MFQFESSEPQPDEIRDEIQKIRESMIPVAGRLALLRPVLPDAGAYWAPISDGGLPQQKARDAATLIRDAFRYLREASEALQQAHDELTEDED